MPLERELGEFEFGGVSFLMLGLYPIPPTPCLLLIVYSKFIPENVQYLYKIATFFACQRSETLFS